MTKANPPQHLLLEIGCEELPASFVAKACAAMPDLIRKLLDQARLSYGEIEAMGTPRRLALRVFNVAAQQPDLDEQVLGPPASIGLTGDGAFSPAALGFAKKQGLGADSLLRIETDKGVYVGFRRVEKGQGSEALLPQILQTLCAQIPFQKSMRWGDLDVAFGRPIHWLVALFGKKTIPFSFAHVESGAHSFGHRFLAPEKFAFADADAYEKTLRKAHVVARAETRRELMLERLQIAAHKLGGVLQHDEFLLEENTSLVEEPYVVAGSFDEEFLALPAEVIVAVMRGHQRYFAVRDANNPEKLLPHYLAVVNTALDPETIVRGNNRVLRARLSDARFFVLEDQKKTFADWQQKLRSVVFQTKLGTVHEKIDRVRALAVQIAKENGVDSETAARATDLAKADLVSLIVGEFPELQGIMGAWYANTRGESDEVCIAIRDHYAPKGASDNVPAQRLAQLVGTADRLDTLVGCFAIGLIPSGSADPFALRRAAIAVLRTAKEGGLALPLRTMLTRAYSALGDKVDASDTAKTKVVDGLIEFFRTRLRSLLEEEGIPNDICEACLAVWTGDSIVDVVERARALREFSARPEYASLKTSVKRAYNISKDYRGVRTLSAPAHYGNGDELSRDNSLFRAIEKCAEPLRALEVRYSSTGEASHADKTAALVTVAGVERELSEYFENTMVMHENPAIRAARLQLCAALVDSVHSFARFDLLRGDASA